MKGRSQFKRYGDSLPLTQVHLAAAQDEFSQCVSIDHKSLDIEYDPLKQGFEAEYDIIVASQVLHATVRIAETVALESG